MEEYRYTFTTAVGILTAVSDGKYLTALGYNLPASTAGGNIGADRLTLLCAEQVGDFLNGRIKKFTVPYRLAGTPFQLRVWHELEKIPYGSVVTYAALASRCGSAKACRAAANACGKNPLAIIVPCHRVVASAGPGGYGGGADAKAFLLLLEKIGSGRG